MFENYTNAQLKDEFLELGVAAELEDVDISLSTLFFRHTRLHELTVEARKRGVDVRLWEAELEERIEINRRE